jgi:excisionase family DNA binding protein
MRLPAHQASPHPDGATEPLLSPIDVATMCGLSRRAVYDAIKRGELRAFKLCSRLRISTADVDAWLAASLVPVSSVSTVPRVSATRMDRLRPVVFARGFVTTREGRDEHRATGAQRWRRLAGALA